MTDEEIIRKGLDEYSSGDDIDAAEDALSRLTADLARKDAALRDANERAERLRLAAEKAVEAMEPFIERSEYYITPENNTRLAAVRAGLMEAMEEKNG